MNDQRRKAIEDVRTRLQEIRGEAESLAEQIDEIEEEERGYFDNMPESFQEGEKGEKAQAAIDNLQSARSSIDDVTTALDEADNSLGDAEE